MVLRPVLPRAKPHLTAAAVGGAYTHASLSGLTHGLAPSPVKPVTQSVAQAFDFSPPSRTQPAAPPAVATAPTSARLSLDAPHVSYTSPHLHSYFGPESAGGLVTPAKPLFTEITVKAGDTLYGLAERHGIPAQYIAAASASEGLLHDVHNLKVGQRLIVPHQDALHLPELIAAAQSVGATLKQYDKQYAAHRQERQRYESELQAHQAQARQLAQQAGLPAGQLPPELQPLGAPPSTLFKPAAPASGNPTDLTGAPTFRAPWVQPHFVGKTQSSLTADRFEASIHNHIASNSGALEALSGAYHKRQAAAQQDTSFMGKVAGFLERSASTAFIGQPVLSVLADIARRPEWEQYFRTKRLTHEAKAEKFDEQIQLKGGVNEWSQVNVGRNGWGDLVNYGSGLVIGTLPVLAEATIGGTLMRGLATAGWAVRAAPPALAAQTAKFAGTLGVLEATTLSSLGSILDAQRDQAGQIHLPTAVALTPLFVAANAVGITGRIGQGTLLQNTIGKIDHIPGVTGFATRTVANMGKLSVTEGLAETWQEGVVSQWARMKVDKHETFFNERAGHRRYEALAGGAFMGGMFGVGGGRRSRSGQGQEISFANSTTVAAQKAPLRLVVDNRGGGGVWSSAPPSGPAVRLAATPGSSSGGMQAQPDRSPGIPDETSVAWLLGHEQNLVPGKQGVWVSEDWTDEQLLRLAEKLDAEVALTLIDGRLRLTSGTRDSVQVAPEKTTKFKTGALLRHVHLDGAAHGVQDRDLAYFFHHKNLETRLNARIIPSGVITRGPQGEVQVQYFGPTVEVNLAKTFDAQQLGVTSTQDVQAQLRIDPTQPAWATARISGLRGEPDIEEINHAVHRRAKELGVQWLRVEWDTEGATQATQAALPFFGASKETRYDFTFGRYIDGELITRNESTSAPGVHHIFRREQSPLPELLTPAVAQGPAHNARGVSYIELWDDSAAQGVELLSERNGYAKDARRHEGAADRVSALVDPLRARSLVHTHVEGETDPQARQPHAQDWVELERINSIRRREGKAELVGTFRYGRKPHHVGYFGVHEHQLPFNAWLMNELERMRQSVTRAIAGARSEQLLGEPLDLAKLKVVGNTAVVRVADVADVGELIGVMSAIHVWASNQTEVEAVRIEVESHLLERVRSWLSYPEYNSYFTVEDFYNFGDGQYDLSRDLNVLTYFPGRGRDEAFQSASKLRGVDRAYALQTLHFAGRLPQPAHLRASPWRPPALVNRSPNAAQDLESLDESGLLSVTFHTPGGWHDLMGGGSAGGKKKGGTRKPAWELNEDQAVRAVVDDPKNVNGLRELLNFLTIIRTSRDGGNGGELQLVQNLLGVYGKTKSWLEQYATQIGVNSTYLASRLESAFDHNGQRDGLTAAIEHIENKLGRTRHSAHWEKNAKAGMTQLISEGQLDLLRAAAALLADGQTSASQNATLSALERALNGEVNGEVNGEINGEVDGKADRRATLDDALQTLTLEGESPAQVLLRIAGDPRHWLVETAAVVRPLGLAGLKGQLTDAQRTQLPALLSPQQTPELQQAREALAQTLGYRTWHQLTLIEGDALTNIAFAHSVRLGVKQLLEVGQTDELLTAAAFADAHADAPSSAREQALAIAQQLGAQVNSAITNDALAELLGRQLSVVRQKADRTLVDAAKRIAANPGVWLASQGWLKRLTAGDMQAKLTDEELLQLQQAAAHADPGSSGQAWPQKLGYANWQWLRWAYVGNLAQVHAEVQSSIALEESKRTLTQKRKGRPPKAERQPIEGAEGTNALAQMDAERHEAQARWVQLRESLPNEWVAPTNFLYWAAQIKPEHLLALRGKSRERLAYLSSQITRTLRLLNSSGQAVEQAAPEGVSIQYGTGNASQIEQALSRFFGFRMGVAEPLKALTRLDMQQVPEAVLALLPHGETPLSVLEKLQGQLADRLSTTRTGDTMRTSAKSQRVRKAAVRRHKVVLGSPASALKHPPQISPEQWVWINQHVQGHSAAQWLESLQIDALPTLDYPGGPAQLKEDLRAVASYVDTALGYLAFDKGIDNVTKLDAKPWSGLQYALLEAIHGQGAVQATSLTDGVGYEVRKHLWAGAWMPNKLVDVLQEMAGSAQVRAVLDSELGAPIIARLRELLSQLRAARASVDQNLPLAQAIKLHPLVLQVRLDWLRTTLSDATLAQVEGALAKASRGAQQIVIGNRTIAIPASVRSDELLDDVRQMRRYQAVATAAVGVEHGALLRRVDARQLSFLYAGLKATIDGDLLWFHDHQGTSGTQSNFETVLSNLLELMRAYWSAMRFLAQDPGARTFLFDPVLGREFSPKLQEFARQIEAQFKQRQADGELSSEEQGEAKDHSHPPEQAPRGERPATDVGVSERLYQDRQRDMQMWLQLRPNVPDAWLPLGNFVYWAARVSPERLSLAQGSKQKAWLRYLRARLERALHVARGREGPPPAMHIEHGTENPQQITQRLSQFLGFQMGIEQPLKTLSSLDLEHVPEAVQALLPEGETPLSVLEKLSQQLDAHIEGRRARFSALDAKSLVDEDTMGPALFASHLYGLEPSGLQFLEGLVQTALERGAFDRAGLAMSALLASDQQLNVSGANKLKAYGVRSALGVTMPVDGLIFQLSRRYGGEQVDPQQALERLQSDIQRELSRPQRERLYNRQALSRINVDQSGSGGFADASPLNALSTYGLQPYQRTVLAWVMAGKTPDQIGALLGKDPQNIRSYETKIRTILGLQPSGTAGGVGDVAAEVMQRTPADLHEANFRYLYPRQFAAYQFLKRAQQLDAKAMHWLTVPDAKALVAAVSALLADPAHPNAYANPYAQQGAQLTDKGRTNHRIKSALDLTEAPYITLVAYADVWTQPASRRLIEQLSGGTEVQDVLRKLHTELVAHIGAQTGVHAGTRAAPIATVELEFGLQAAWEAIRPSVQGGRRVPPQGIRNAVMNAMGRLSPPWHKAIRRELEGEVAAPGTLGDNVLRLIIGQYPGGAAGLLTDVNRVFFNPRKRVRKRASKPVPAQPQVPAQAQAPEVAIDSAAADPEVEAAVIPVAPRATQGADVIHPTALYKLEYTSLDFLSAVVERALAQRSLDLATLFSAEELATNNSQRARSMIRNALGLAGKPNTLVQELSARYSGARADDPFAALESLRLDLAREGQRNKRTRMYNRHALALEQTAPPETVPSLESYNLQPHLLVTLWHLMHGKTPEQIAQELKLSDVRIVGNNEAKLKKLLGLDGPDVVASLMHRYRNQFDETWNYLARINGAIAADLYAPRRIEKFLPQEVRAQDYKRLELRHIYVLARHFLTDGHYKSLLDALFSSVQAYPAHKMPAYLYETNEALGLNHIQELPAKFAQDPDHPNPEAFRNALVQEIERRAQGSSRPFVERRLSSDKEAVHAQATVHSATENRSRFKQVRVPVEPGQPLSADRLKLPSDNVVALLASRQKNNKTNGGEKSDTVQPKLKGDEQDAIPRRVVQQLLTLEPLEVMSLWAVTEAEMSNAEASAVLGLERSAFDKALNRNIARIVGVLGGSASRDSLIPLLSLVAGKDHTAGDVLWQLATDPQAWIAKQTYAPVFTDEHIAAIARMTGSTALKERHLAFLESWVKHKGDADKVARELDLTTAMLNKDRSLAQRALGIASYAEWKARYPQGLPQFVKKLRALIQSGTPAQRTTSSQAQPATAPTEPREGYVNFSTRWLDAQRRGVETASAREGGRWINVEGTENHVIVWADPGQLSQLHHVHPDGATQVARRMAGPDDVRTAAQINQARAAQQRGPLVQSIGVGPREHHLIFYGKPEAQLSPMARAINELEHTRREISEAIRTAHALNPTGLSLPGDVVLKSIDGVLVLRMPQSDAQAIAQVTAWAQGQQGLHTLRLEVPGAANAAAEKSPDERRTVEDHYDITTGDFDLNRELSVTTVPLRGGLAQADAQIKNLPTTARAYAYQSLYFDGHRAYERTGVDGAINLTPLLRNDRPELVSEGVATAEGITPAEVSGKRALKLSAPKDDEPPNKGKGNEEFVFDRSYLNGWLTVHYRKAIEDADTQSYELNVHFGNPNKPQRQEKDSPVADSGAMLSEAHAQERRELEGVLDAEKNTALLPALLGFLERVAGQLKAGAAGVHAVDAALDPWGGIEAAARDIAAQLDTSPYGLATRIGSVFAKEPSEGINVEGLNTAATYVRQKVDELRQAEQIRRASLPTEQEFTRRLYQQFVLGQSARLHNALQLLQGKVQWSEPELQELQQLTRDLGGKREVVPSDGAQLAMYFKDIVAVGSGKSVTVEKYLGGVLSSPTNWARKHKLVAVRSFGAIINAVTKDQLDLLLRHARGGNSEALVQAELQGILEALGYRTWFELQLAYPQGLGELESAARAFQRAEETRLLNERLKLEQQRKNDEQAAQRALEKKAAEEEKARLAALKTQIAANRAKLKTAQQTPPQSKVVAQSSVPAHPLLEPALNVDTLIAMAQQATPEQIRSWIEAIESEAYSQNSTMLATVRQYVGGPGELVHNLKTVLGVRLKAQADAQRAAAKQAPEATPRTERRPAPPKEPKSPKPVKTAEQIAVERQARMQEKQTQRRDEAVEGFVQEMSAWHAAHAYPLTKGQAAYLLSWVLDVLRHQFDVAKLTEEQLRHPDLGQWSQGSEATLRGQIREITGHRWFFDRTLSTPAEPEQRRSADDQDGFFSALKNLRGDLIRQIERHGTSQNRRLPDDAPIHLLRATQASPASTLPALRRFDAYNLLDEEIQVLKHLVARLNAQQISEAMGLSKDVVQGHINNLRQILGLTHADLVGELLSRYPEAEEGQAPISNNAVLSHHQLFFNDLENLRQTAQAVQARSEGGTDTPPVPPAINRAQVKQLAELAQGRSLAQWQSALRAGDESGASAATDALMPALGEAVRYQQQVGDLVSMVLPLMDTLHKRDVDYFEHVLREALNAGRDNVLEAPRRYMVPSAAEASRREYDLRQHLGLPKHFFHTLRAIVEDPVARTLILDPTLGQPVVGQLETLYANLTRAQAKFPDHTAAPTLAQSATHFLAALNQLHPADLYALTPTDTVYLLRLMAGATSASQTTAFDSAVKADWDNSSTVGEVHRRVARKLGFEREFDAVLGAVLNKDVGSDTERLPQQVVQQARQRIDHWRLELTRHLDRLQRNPQQVDQLRAALDPTLLNEGPALDRPLADYNLTLTQAKMLFFMLRGHTSATAAALLGLSPRTLHEAEVALRKQLGVDHPDLAAALWQRHNDAGVMQQRPDGTWIKGHGAPFYEELLGVIGPKNLMGLAPDLDAELLARGQRQRADGAQTLGNTPAAWLDADLKVQQFNPQPLWWTQGKALSADTLARLSDAAVWVLDGVVNARTADEVMAHSGLSARAVQAYGQLLPAWLGFKSYDELLSAYPQGAVQLKWDLAQNFEARKGRKMFGAPAPNKELPLDAAADTPAMRTEVARRLMEFTDTEVTALWAVVEAGFMVEEVAASLGVDKEEMLKTVNRVIQRMVTTVGPGAPRGYLAPVLRSVAGEGQSEADLMWQLVTDRRAWVQAQSFAPPITEASVQAMARGLTPTQVDFLQRWVTLRGNTTVALIEKGVQLNRAHKYVSDILNPLGVGSYRELELRYPGTMQELVEQVVAVKQSS